MGPSKQKKVDHYPLLVKIFFAPGQFSVVIDEPTGAAPRTPRLDDEA
jgi:hypothetical protein